MGVYTIKEGGRGGAVGHLLERECAFQTISLLSLILHDEQDLVIAQVAEALSGLIESLDQIERPNLSYKFAELLTWLEQKGPEHPELPMLEFQLFDYVFNHEAANALYKSLGNSCDSFAHVMQCLFSADGNGVPKELRSAFKQRCWSVLYYWQRLPGLRDDGIIDGEHLAEWINGVRTRLNADGHERDYDGQIGGVLASSPDGKDGMWPAEELRDILESLRNPKLEEGLFRGRLNRRGVTIRGIFEGGMQETSLAARYREDARRMNAQWPRTAGILNRLAEDYEREALREDPEAEQWGDQD